MPLLRRKNVPREAEIPTASMADIAFLLIIFFMVTSIFSRDKGLKLVLPEKGSEVKVEKEKLFVISINDAGEVFLGDEKVTLGEIEPRVTAKLSVDPKLILFIKTHEKAPYERMIEVFDVVKGIPEATRVSIGVIRPGAG